MSKKAQAGVGVFIMVTVVIIVGLVILGQVSFTNIGTMTKTVNVVNGSVTAPAYGAVTYLNGQAARDIVVINATSNTIIPSTNYTVTNYVNVNGELKTVFNASGNSNLGWYGKSINVTYTYEPYGYDTNSGNRSVIALVAIFAALAVAVIALVPVLREEVIDLIS